MPKHASGTFDVTLAPQPLAESAGTQTLGRMSISKTFAGDLQGTSKGEMLVAGTDVKGSAGYVAVERVEGRLNGRSGGFSLQHSGTMNRGAARLSVSVVPDSGTGDLAGIDGTLRIEIVGGKHRYEFDYTLADKE